MLVLAVMTLIRSLSAHLRTGALHELTLTTNGTQLAKYAGDLAACGIGFGTFPQ
jgi:cyclic pyranopterin phosphate synthase